MSAGTDAPPTEPADAEEVAGMVTGPDRYWDDSIPPSRGQCADIAKMWCELAGIPWPKSRFEATTLMVRLRHAVLNHGEIELPDAPF